MPQKPNTHILAFSLERETKNTVRYAENSPAPIVGTLYVAKLALTQPWPTRLQVTIEEQP